MMSRTQHLPSPISLAVLFGWWRSMPESFIVSQETAGPSAQPPMLDTCGPISLRCRYCHLDRRMIR